MKIFKDAISKLGLNFEEFLFQFQSHPHYPSALAFSDTLKFMGIKNDAYELDKEYWSKLPEVYIALVDNSFSLVEKRGNDFTIYSDKIKTLNKEELYKNSDDFVLLFEKTNNVKPTAFFNFRPFIYTIFGIIFLYSLLEFTWCESMFNLLSLLGVYISLELFNQKFGQESVVVSNICSGAANSNSKSSCAKIFSADKTNVLGLKISDFSLIYFLGITFIGLLLPGSQFILKIISLISVVVILYSLYVQTFVEKSLCRVCLFIIFILLAQIAVSSFYFSLVISLPIVFISVIAFISLFLTIAFLNNLINQKEELKKSNAKNLRFKRNYELFKRELLSKDKIEFSDENIFFLGKKNAKLHISVISNPYCGFCKDAHKILEDLLSKYPDKISAQLRFNYVGGNVEEKYTQLISGFLNIYKNKSQQEFLKAIDSWFENRDEEEISKKTKSKVSEDLTDIIQNTVENIEAQLNFTPIFIINGYQFPDKYERDDIFYFIDDLLEDEEIMKKI